MIGLRNAFKINDQAKAVDAIFRLSTGQSVDWLPSLQNGQEYQPVGGMGNRGYLSIYGTKSCPVRPFRRQGVTWIPIWTKFNVFSAKKEEKNEKKNKDYKLDLLIFW